MVACWLHAHTGLEKRCRLPPKTMFSTRTPEFCEQRRVRLQLFMEELLVQNAQNLPPVRTFLGLPDLASLAGGEMDMQWADDNLQSDSDE